MSSLVYIANSGKKSLTGEQKRQMAEMAGIRFIKLVHKLMCNSPRGTMGFQSVTVRTQDEEGGRRVYASWAKNEINEDTSKGELVFHPNEFQQGVAFLPDSVFNRKKLAATLYNGLWVIQDERIREEIRPLAEKLRDDQKRIEREREKTKVSGERAKELATENSALKKKLEALSVMNDSQAYSPPEPVNIVPDIVSKVTRDQLILDREILNKAKEKAKKIVFDEMAEAVTRIKEERIKANGNERGWASTPEYKDEILPKIEVVALEIVQKEFPEVYGRITHGFYPEPGEQDI